MQRFTHKLLYAYPFMPGYLFADMLEGMSSVQSFTHKLLYAYPFMPGYLFADMPTVKRFI